MVFVHKYFEPSALEGFVKVLRGKQISELRKDCPPSAYKSRAIFNAIQNLSFPARMDSDALKRMVADQIFRDMGDFQGAKEYDLKYGEGKYIKACSNFIRDSLRKAAQP
jgi:hypothetical protein